MLENYFSLRVYILQKMQVKIKRIKALVNVSVEKYYK